MKKDNFQDEQKAIQAFKDLFINASIESIIVENEGKNPLSIIIDGGVYSNVDRINIRPAFNENEMPVTLPIQSFLQ